MNNKYIPIEISLHREPKGTACYIFSDIQQLHSFFTINELLRTFIDENIAKEKTSFLWSDGRETLIFIYLKEEKETFKQLETIRKASANLSKLSESVKDIEQLAIINATENEDLAAAAIEGIILSAYTFDKYKTKPSKPKLKNIQVHHKHLSKKKWHQVKAILEGVYIARNLVNEPPNVLTATQLAHNLKDMAKNAGVKCGIYSKAKIEQLGMGGILAVNKGSIEEPTFTVLEYKHPQASNLNKPIVLVGKGVVYDTGGLSLKPTPNSMDKMKSDMSGAAVVAGIMHAVGSLELHLHIVALIPATDNRPGMNAYTPGDIIKMYSGQTVEVLNTDAEGRMILADALHFAKRYEPQIVIDIATLTGAASAAIGSVAMVGMGTDEQVLSQLQQAGDVTYERIVSLPLWEEYDAMIQSDVADMKNVGGPTAGAITAGKFLQRFVAYPWVHLDIAGVSFRDNRKDYYTTGGTGFGIRNIMQWLLHKAQ